MSLKNSSHTFEQAVWTLVEELYHSAKRPDVSRVRSSLNYLAEMAGIEGKHLAYDLELEKQAYDDAAVEYAYDEYLDRMYS